MQYEIKHLGKFKYIEEGNGEPLVLLHGLFGALSNFQDLLEHFRKTHMVIIPMLPLFDLSVLDTSVNGLSKHVAKFMDARGLDKVHLMGNSLGGHVGLVYTLKHQNRVKTITLTGSSGLFENGMGETYPKRNDREFMRKKTELTFYDPKMATTELVDEIYSIVNNRIKAIKIIALAKSAIRHNLGDELKEIKVPTCLIWGKNDTITPPMVAEEFKSLIPNSELHWIDKCGHAPMMEVPGEFNEILSTFLAKHEGYKEMMRAYDRSDKKNKRQKEALIFIKQKLDAAKWFIDAIKQRQHTLLQTMHAIIDFQKEFFLTGDEITLKPMILKDIAQLTMLDVSTVSRVANSKFVQTEFGTYKLKYFFSEALQTDSGEEVSTREVKNILNEIIGGENKRKPYSDEKLTDMLQEKGYNIARRTVAKYREQLNIPVARLRKEL